MVLYPKRQESSPVPLQTSQPVSGTLLFIPALLCSSARTFLHSDIRRCNGPSNKWIKCPNLCSELPRFRGSISFSAQPTQQIWTAFYYYQLDTL